MLKLLGMKDCAVCEESKKQLSEHNAQFEFMDLTENIDLAKRFSIKVAGKYLYDDEKDEVILVSDYLSQIGG